MVGICYFKKHGACGFECTHCIVRLGKGNKLHGNFCNNRHQLFWLFTFLMNVNHASWKKNTSFIILFLSSTEYVILYFSTIHIFLIYMTLLMWNILYKTFTNIFFHDLCVCCKSIANELPLFNRIHFLNALTSFFLPIVAQLSSCNDDVPLCWLALFNRAHISLWSNDEWHALYFLICLILC